MSSWRRITSLTYSQIKDLQNQRLHSFINTHVYPFSAFYRKLFDDKKIDPRSIRTKGDLKRIPYISKSDLIDKDNPQKYKDFILHPNKETLKQYWPKSRLLALAAKSMVQGRRLEDDLEPCKEAVLALQLVCRRAAQKDRLTEHVVLIIELHPDPTV